MKKIPLTQGKFAIVDNKDFKWLSQYNWVFDSRYAKAANGKRNAVLVMHRLIMQTPKGMDTDHINGDGLDNQRKNLRVCTHAQNLANRLKQKDNTSGFKGVYWSKDRKKWMAQVRFHGKKYQSRHKTKEQAARAYDEMAKKYFGEFARLNFKAP